MTFSCRHSKRCLAIELDYKDCEAIINAYADPKSRDVFNLFINGVTSAAAHFYYCSPIQLLSEKVDFVYNLLRPYWNPHREDDIRASLEGLFRDQVIDIGVDDCGLRRVNVIQWGGQAKLLLMLVRNMQPEMWRQLSEGRNFAQVNKALSGVVLVMDKRSSTKKLWHPLKYAIRKVAEETRASQSVSLSR